MQIFRTDHYSASTRAFAMSSVCALIAAAAPASAGNGNSDLCTRLEKLAIAGRDGTVHAVRIFWVQSADEPSCETLSEADRAVCRWLIKYVDREQVGMLRLSKEALQCLGHDPEPPMRFNPDEITGGAWWSGGTFRPESGPLAIEQVDFAMEMDLKSETGPWWIEFSARPK